MRLKLFLLGGALARKRLGGGIRMEELARSPLAHACS
jgi:hypothetical protein